MQSDMSFNFGSASGTRIFAVFCPSPSNPRLLRSNLNGGHLSQTSEEEEVIKDFQKGSHKISV
jgi:hypothetical protein